MHDVLNAELDAKFNEIKNLAWYPWVGKDYKNAPYKVLVVGESLYAVDENGVYDEETCNRFKSDKNVIVDLTKDVLQGRGKKFHKNLAALFLDSHADVRDFYSRIVFYDFIQRPVKQVSGDVGNSDYLEGWYCWYELIKLLRPDICVFCGISMKKQFPEFNQKLGLEWDTKWKDVTETEFYHRGRRVFPVVGSFGVDDHITKLLFVQHPSTMPHPENWHEFLKQQIPEVIDWLNTK